MDETQLRTPIEEHTVATMVRAWLAAFAAARECGSVSAACRSTGCQRSAYYRAQAAYRARGVDGLRELARRCLIRTEDVASKLDEVILSVTREHPEWGRVRVSNALNRRGVKISPSRVRTAWRRHGIDAPRKPKPPASFLSRKDVTASATSHAQSCEGEGLDHLWLAS